MPPAAKSSTSCSAKNKFSAAKGSSFRSPSSQKLRVQQPASWRLGRLGIFFFFLVQLKGKAGWVFSSFFFFKPYYVKAVVLFFRGKNTTAAASEFAFKIALERVGLQDRLHILGQEPCTGHRTWRAPARVKSRLWEKARELSSAQQTRCQPQD